MDGARGYWYACTRIAGKVMKRYLGKSSVLTVGRLEEIASQFQTLAVQQKPAFPDATRAKEADGAMPRSMQEDRAPLPASVQEPRVHPCWRQQCTSPSFLQGCCRVPG